MGNGNGNGIYLFNKKNSTIAKLETNSGLKEEGYVVSFNILMNIYFKDLKIVLIVCQKYKNS